MSMLSKNMFDSVAQTFSFLYLDTDSCPNTHTYR